MKLYEPSIPKEKMLSGEVRLTPFMEYFNFDSFLKRYSNQNTPFHTRQISDWLNCSIRYVQKYAASNGVPFQRIDGRKYYMWDEDSLRDFTDWHNLKKANERK
jgi:hypothetical protein